MGQFNLKDFLRRAEDTWEEFARLEEKDFPEHEHILQTPRQINEAFKQGLDEVRLEAGIDPGGLYISTKPDGTPSVNLGATLLDIKIVFQLSIDVPKLSRKWRKKCKGLPFEQKVKDEYDRCEKLYRQISQELEITWRACDVPPDELEQAIGFIEEAHGRALKKYSALYRNMGSEASQKQAVAEAANLAILLKKLQSLSQKRA